MKLEITISRSGLMETVFLLEVLDMVLNVVFASMNMGQLVSITIAASYILTACLLVLLFLERSNYSKTLFLIYTGILLISLFSVLLSGGPLSFFYFRKWLGFFSTFTLFFWAAYVRVSEKIVRCLKYASVFLGCYFCVLYAAGKTYPLGSVGITFNLGNPNFTGMWLLSECLLLASFIPREKGKMKQILLIGITLALVFFIRLTNARACMIAFAYFLIASVMFKKKYSKSIMVVSIFLPLVFAVIYMQVVETDWFHEMFAFMVSEGKGLDSRQSLWGIGFEYFLKSPIFGNYYDATEGTGLGQLHNIYVDTLAAYGGIVQILVLSFLSEIACKIIREKMDDIGRVALYAFGAVLVSGTFEAGLFANSQGMYVLAAGLLILARYRNIEKNVEVQEKR